MSNVIKVENLSKQYRLGEIGTGSISHDLNRWWHTVRGKEDPYLKIGETNDRSKKGESEYVWSLKDINFEIEQGDAVGIIGRNGAGKSTLLKILSRVTGPTTGSLKVKGRIASLLEVGTGFHPELSGRENIFLNGAILGMRKHEIQRKFDEIVDFSGVERYIDTPVKRYSSGMYVRLAFAVAAHLESEILIVDEVLAVGDAEFQKKCLGKMNDVSKGEGRTILFVSHNLDAVKKLCNKGILLQNGNLIHKGNITSTLHNYLKNYTNDNSRSKLIFEINELKEAQILKVELKDDLDAPVIDYVSNQDIFVKITILNKCKNENARLNFSILDKYENVIFITRRNLDFQDIKTWIVKVPKNTLIANSYIIGLALDIPKIKLLDFPENKLQLNIINIAQEEFKDGDTENGIFKIPVEWKM
jgi:lipopolysaccharide transport system ATP-binding protein